MRRRRSENPVSLPGALLASELAGKGARVTIIDADPERWISQWGRLPGRPASINIVSDVGEDTIVDAIEAAAAGAQFVIVDLEGTANLLVANAVGMSDLIIVPTQGASMDAKGAGKMLRLIRDQERMARRAIRHAVVLTRTSVAVTSRSLRNVRDQLSAAGISILATSIVERAAYRDLFDFGGLLLLLADLDAGQVSNLDKAVRNALEFAGEVLAMLKAPAERKAA